MNSELQNIKIQMEAQKDFSEHKILNLELAKNLLEQELLNKREKYDLDSGNTSNSNDNLDSLDSLDSLNSHDSLIKTQEELIKKGKEIDKLKRENAMLTINNQQLQYELIRTIKQMQ